MNNIFEEIGFNSEEAKILEFKAQIMSLLKKLIEENKIKPRQLEKILDVPQPRISDLLTGKIDKMKVDKLLQYLFRLSFYVIYSALKGQSFWFSRSIPIFFDAS